MVGGNSIFLITDNFGLYLDSFGLALAIMEVLAFN
jgi:hypothetical protein